jgi:uncharacterized protein YceK
VFGGGVSSTVCRNPGFGGCGLIYKLTKPASGSTWTKSTLYAFAGGADGIGPRGNLIISSTGVLYGVTEWGGCTPTLTYGYGCGTVFMLTPPASGSTWTYARLYDFKGGTADGAYPGGPLALDTSGNLYGATLFGGTVNCTTQNGSPDGGRGTVFKLSLSGTSYTESVLHFFTDLTNGSIPSGGVVLDSSGNVYGTTLQGSTDTGLCLNFGYSGCGQVFELVKPASGTSWTKQTIINFKGSDGAAPSALLRDSAGGLYGVNAYNSSADTGCGSAFKLTDTSGVWTETMLYSFTGASSVADPEFGMAFNSSGVLYGVTGYNVTSTLFSLGGTGFLRRRR